MYDEGRNNMTPEQLDAHNKEMAKSIPLTGKFGDLEKDITPVLVLLASNASKFITAQLIPVNGGFSSAGNRLE